MSRCEATIENDILTLSTGRISYVAGWNHGHLIGRQLQDARTDILWNLTGEAPDCEFPGQIVDPDDGSLEIEEFRGSSIQPPHVRATVTTRLDRLEVRRVFRLYPDCPAIGCDLYLRGSTHSRWRVATASASDLSNIENKQAADQGRIEAATMHRVFVEHQHLRVTAVAFRDITDRNNNLVSMESVQPYRQPLQLDGNILFCRDRLQDRAFLLLKEAPCSGVQLSSPGCDFVCRANEIRIVGIGVTPDDLSRENWTRCYGFAIGISQTDEYSLLSTLRSYQEKLRVRIPKRDEMILVNTWGDRGQDKKMSEAFVLNEIRASTRLGATHLQLDHGWETTQDASNTWPLRLQDIWATPHFWNVHPCRFPNGLGPCVQKARDDGIELCIWFNPSSDSSYARWRDDADVLIDMHRQYGIRTFKIDGVQITDKTAEINFRRMLDTVVEATEQQAVFNLDVTAGRRFGYHYFNEYGNYFLENRYTDWSNYYPHWTLRNLWMLSRYVPAQSLQIEFLNRWRNPDKYPANDPLAPRNIPFEYCFAIAMMAQPLAWFEASELPDEAFKIAPIVRKYARHQPSIHEGQILPIGEEPCGTAWTGFQSIRGSSGYFLVFRELCDTPLSGVRCWNLDGKSVRCRHVVGQGEDFVARADADGRIAFSLPEPFSFALYSYDIV